MRTRVALLCCVVLLAAGCGGRQEVFLDEPADETPAIELPDPVPAAPAYVARLKRPLKAKGLANLGKTPGVAVLAPVTVRSMTVRSGKRVENLKVGAVDPLPFRSVAPPSTRDAEFVWTALFADLGVITLDGARSLGIDSATEIVIGKKSITIGAFADNGMPNIADLIVSTTIARTIDLGAPNILVVGAKTGTTIETLGHDLRRKLPGVRLTRIRAVTSSTVLQPAAPQRLGSVSGATIGTMSFRILNNGYIDPDDAWVAANIASATVPILGGVRCHRLMIPQLAAALGEIQEAGLASEIRPDEYAGCWVPRFIDRDPRRGLSMHAFGLAVDLNTSTNQLGTRGDMHPQVVQIFQKWGFAWGGYWGQPDPMHFELARIVRP